MKFSKEDLIELTKILEELTESGDTYVKAGDEAVKSLQPLLSAALRILLEASNDTRKDLEPELVISANLSAKAKRRDYAAYVRAGFTKEQAFMLILASVKPFSLADLMKSVNTSSSNSKKS